MRKITTNKEVQKFALTRRIDGRDMWYTGLKTQDEQVTGFEEVEEFESAFLFGDIEGCQEVANWIEREDTFNVKLLVVPVQMSLAVTVEMPDIDAAAEAAAAEDVALEDAVSIDVANIYVPVNDTDMTVDAEGVE
jgi:hypothetical protein